MDLYLNPLVKFISSSRLNYSLDRKMLYLDVQVNPGLLQAQLHVAPPASSNNADYAVKLEVQS
jgi:hypothetical protein